MMQPMAAMVFGFIHVNDADMPHGVIEWLWLCIGLSGSGIFGIRFFIQWMHSEKHKESRIPVSFWWLSVAGTIMAASYFIHKQQWVALLGNGPQLVPYLRNLMLIYRKRDGAPPMEVAGPTPPATTPDAVLVRS
jgi:lipid-A-disaccharide synthase-like uncharacterized protein